MYRDYLTCMESEHKTNCGFNPAKKARNMLDSKLTWDTGNFRSSDGGISVKAGYHKRVVF